MISCHSVIATIFYTTTSGYGCKSTVSEILTVLSTPSVASISGGTTLCAGSNLSLTDATTGGTWYSSNTSDATVSGGTVTGVSSGSVNILYVVTASGCADTVTKAITVNALPTVAPLVGSSSVCVGDTIHLTDATPAGGWGISNFTVAGVFFGVVSGVAPGTDTIFYTITSGGCSNKVYKVITVNATPTANFTITGDTTFCSGDSVLLTANSGTGYTYQWRAGGSNIGGATHSGYEAKSSGLYSPTDKGSKPFKSSQNR